MILVEARFYPFVLMSFRGGPHTREEYQTMFATNAAIGRRALREHTRHVHITLGGSEMNAAERKMIAREMEKFPRELLDLVLASYVIADRPLVYGMLTALRWLSPKLVILEPVPSLEAGMAAATTALAQAGIEVPGTQALGARHWLRAQVALMRQPTSEVP